MVEFEKTKFSVGHRGVKGQVPEEELESGRAAGERGPGEQRATGCRGETEAGSPLRFFEAGNEGGRIVALWLIVVSRLLSSCRHLFEFLVGSVLRNRRLQGCKDDAGRLLNHFQRLGQQ